MYFLEKIYDEKFIILKKRAQISIVCFLAMLQHMHYLYIVCWDAG